MPFHQILYRILYILSRLSTPDGVLLFIPKGDKNTETLILLYALAGSNDIPQGCFIAAWVLVSVKLILKIIELVLKRKLDE